MTDTMRTPEERRLANSLQPISRLPNEVLLEVFQESTDQNWTASWQDGRLSDHSRIQILHVCHRWYSIGVNCPSLWTTYEAMGSVEWTKEVLRRASGLPLRVTFRDTSPNKSDSLPLLMARMPQIEELRLGISYLNCLQFEREIMPFVQSPESLKTLHLSVEGDEVSTPQILKLSSLFPGHLPTLQRLSINSNIHIEGRISAPGLRHLELAQIQWGNEGFTEVGVLLASLREMPLLETVQLSHVVSCRGADPPNGQQACGAILLPSIRSFSMREPFVDAVVHILQMIQIPSSAQLSISIDYATPGYMAALAGVFEDKHKIMLADGKEGSRRIGTLAIVSPSGYRCDDLMLQGCSDVHRDVKDTMSQDGACSRKDASLRLDVSIAERSSNLIHLLDLPSYRDVQTLHIGGNENNLAWFPVENRSYLVDSLSSLSRVKRLFMPVAWYAEMPQNCEEMRNILPNLEYMVLGDSVTICD